jgi:iron complex transport system substrate-binding protein
MQASITTRRRSRAVAIAVALGVAVAACGGDDADDAASDTTEAAAPETTAAGPDTTEGDAPATTAGSEGAQAGETRTITHEQGTVEVPVDPQRIVSVGYEEQQMLLHFGKVPLMVRDYTEGTQPFGVWPWDIEYLDGAEPEVFVDDLPYERIAALEPDLIMAVNGGLEGDQYARLTEIAPTVAQPVGYGPWDAPGDVQFLAVGEVFGMEDEAQAMLDEAHGMMDDVAAAHPEWSDMTAATLTIWDPVINADTTEHVRGQVMEALGFQPITEDVLPFVEGYPTVPFEQIDLLDEVDLLLWMDFADSPAAITDLPLRDALTAHTEGREVYVDAIYSPAFRILPHTVEYLLEWLVPQLEAAADADPSTPVESSVDAGIAPG